MRGTRMAREHYMYGSPTYRWLLIRIILLQSHSILSHPPTPMYVANLASYLDSRSMPLRHGSFPALGYVMQPIYGLLGLARHAAGPIEAC